MNMAQQIDDVAERVRKCLEQVDTLIATLPAGSPEWLKVRAIDHELTAVQKTLSGEVTE